MVVWYLVVFFLKDNNLSRFNLPMIILIIILLITRNEMKKKNLLNFHEKDGRVARYIIDCYYVIVWKTISLQCPVIIDTIVPCVIINQT